MNMPATHIIVYILAVWRISSLFVREGGPFRMFVHIREWAGIQHDEQGMPWMIPDTFFAQLLGCIWCFSVWVGVGLLPFILFLPEFAIRFAIPFALSAGAIALDGFIQKSR